MQILNTPLRIGNTMFYAKVNPVEGQRYISVDSYHKKFEKREPRKFKEVRLEIYDTKRKVFCNFNSVREAEKELKIHRNTIYNIINKTGIRPRRYEIKIKGDEQKKDTWEYSNKNFSEEQY